MKEYDLKSPVFGCNEYDEYYYIKLTVLMMLFIFCEIKL